MLENSINLPKYFSASLKVFSLVFRLKEQRYPVVKQRLH